MGIRQSSGGLKRIVFAGSVVDIRYQGRAAARLIDSLLQTHGDKLEITQSPPTADFTYKLVGNDANVSFDLYAGDDLERRCISGPEMALYLMNQICYHLAYHSKGGLVLHAGLVSRREQGLLLPGTTGRGKTILTAWLIRCGYTYLTDELVFIPEESLVGYGLGRLMNLKGGARMLEQVIFGIPLDDPVIMHTDNVDLIPVEKFGAYRILPSTKLAAIVFPEFKAGADFSYSPLTKAQAGLGIMQCLINARNLPGHGFSDAAGLARRLPAFEMTYGDVSQIGAEIERIFDPSEEPREQGGIPIDEQSALL